MSNYIYAASLLKYTKTLSKKVILIDTRTVDGTFKSDETCPDKLLTALQKHVAEYYGLKGIYQSVVITSLCKL